MKDKITFKKWFKEKHMPLVKKIAFEVKNSLMYQLIDKYPKLYEKWNSIDKKKDKSWSAHDFKFWLYLRLCDQDKYAS